MTKILVVDDTPVDQRLVGRLLEKNSDLQTSYASNGKQALEVIARESPDLVLTDLQMPEMDGLELVQRIRTDFSAIPVILMTAYGNEDIALKALRQGAANYVPKKNLARDLLDTVDSVLAAATDHRLQRRLFASLLQTESRFCLENDLAMIPALVNHLRENLTRLCLLDDTGLIRITVALREALMNAIVHGNLGIGSALREADLGAYGQLVGARRMQSPYRERRVHVHASASTAETRYVIRDEGMGFDPRVVPDPTDPANMEQASGRGMLLIRTFMDEVSHNPEGNEITLVKRRDRQEAQR